ncbi:LOW QUALITY PROTEIN: putative nuclease HARBI1 [Pomacea canaliculata]|uniref:LOW QUALITY PROTEIN: putative nuclease HARBI1 n=1 Tax=Pomacea canaliculata TaxID=400727 RepID=UPI000D73818C|nr:LOW QUALITY PROTEIN: putative nuclease HARBI1 [Pomacea canaliculata]
MYRLSVMRLHANLVYINIVVKWPGSVHDARILRESPFYDAIENNQPPQGTLLEDSGYIQRDWLMTPVSNPESPEERMYNELHKQTLHSGKKHWCCKEEVALLMH